MKTISEIKEEIKQADLSGYPALYEAYAGDNRSGVKKLLETDEEKRTRTGKRKAAH